MRPLWDRLKKINLVKKLVYVVVGSVSYPGLNIFNKLHISGTEHLEKLPKENVLFVSNHQTYFADVVCFLHIFAAIKWGKRNKLGVPYYLLNPFTRVYFVAAEETMKSNWITRIFALAGALKVKRTWNPEAKVQRKGLDPSDTRKVTRSLTENWIITFPQGTTKPFAPGRKGTGLIIRTTKPIVIPVVIDGFADAFNKTGLQIKKRGVKLSVRFKAPLELDYNMPADQMLEVIMDSIEQSKKFMPVTTQPDVNLNEPNN
jgi:1-acyl-sn-glycerol-3-phosphate acyltransferase